MKALWAGQVASVCIETERDGGKEIQIDGRSEALATSQKTLAVLDTYNNRYVYYYEPRRKKDRRLLVIL